MMLHPEAFGARQAAVQRVLLAVTWSSCVGTMVMAAFPSDPVPHGIGSAIAFACGCIYHLWQTILLYKVPGISKKICHIRLSACIILVICLLTLSGCDASRYLNICTGDCSQICTDIFIVAEWTALMLLLIIVLTCCHYCQQLCLKISWRNITISLREKNQDQV
ncbi:DNA damage-regulated autophagy modulator protein 1-like isoform X2 [Dendropsophus ebraccatus]